MHDTQALQRTTVPEKDAVFGAGSTPAPERRSRRADWRKRGEIALLSGPALIMFLGFVILPVAMAAFYGFFKWNGFGWPTEFIGLDNYVMIWQDDTFRQAVLHNGIILVLSLVLQGPIAILFALLMNQKIRGRSIIRILIFVPYVISEVIVGIGWSLMLQDAGALNSLLEKWGLGDFQQSWIADPAIAMTSLMIIITWKYLGFAVILMLAGMQSIPEELYEAAAIDGAGPLRRFRFVTLPLLRPTLYALVALSTIYTMRAFDLIWTMTHGGPVDSSNIFPVWSYRLSFEVFDFAGGAAISTLMLAVVFVVALAYVRSVRAEQRL